MKTKLLSAFLMSCILFTSCKKNDPSPADNTTTVDANGNIQVPNDCNGAMYSITSRLYDDNSGTTYDEIDNATAWFGTAANNVSAGIVRSNSEDLQMVGSGPFNWYFSTNPDIFTDSNVSWEITGDGATGVSAFTYTDATPFPSSATFTLPATININNSFTLNNAASGNVYAV